MIKVDVYNTLRDRILSSKYSEGEGITELSIASELGVSRTPVREAFAKLYIDGLVEARPNRGIVVKNISVQDIMDMYELRLHIEPLAVVRACIVENKTIYLDKMKRILQNIEKAIISKDFNTIQEYDLMFHNEIIKMSESRILENTMAIIMHNTKIVRITSLSIGKRAENAYKEHLKIYEAIKSGDKEKSVKMMKTHIENAKRNYLKRCL